MQDRASGPIGALNVPEAARYLGIHERLLRRLVAEGRVRASRIGDKRVVIALSELDRVLREGTGPAREGAPVGAA